jgi:hypothetical protein
MIAGREMVAPWEGGNEPECGAARSAGACVRSSDVGLGPVVNVIARLSSSGKDSQYGFSGTWKLGLVAAGSTFVAVKILLLRSARAR